MPEYLATLARNERFYSKWKFAAGSDAEALAYLKECWEAGCVPWEPAGETGDSVAFDPVLMLRRNGGLGGKDETIAGEIRMPGAVYYSDLMRFAERVAQLAGADDETLDALIQDARDLIAGHRT